MDNGPSYMTVLIRYTLTFPGVYFVLSYLHGASLHYSTVFSGLLLQSQVHSTKFELGLGSGLIMIMAPSPFALPFTASQFMQIPINLEACIASRPLEV
jgi:hypothetical protein